MEKEKFNFWIRDLCPWFDEKYSSERFEAHADHDGFVEAKLVSRLALGTGINEEALMQMDNTAVDFYLSGMRVFLEIYQKMRSRGQLPAYRNGRLISSNVFVRRLGIILQEREIPLRYVWQDVTDAILAGLSSDEIVKRGICKTKDTPNKINASLGKSRRKVPTEYKKMILDYVAEKQTAETFNSYSYK